MRPRGESRLLNRANLGERELMSYERVLAECLRSFIAELFHTNAGVVIGYIQANQENNIRDLIASSAELSVRPDVLHYGHNASISSDWGIPPVVIIDMEMRHPELSIYFDITFEEKTVGVSIKGIMFAKPLGTPEENLSRFKSAIAEVRLTEA